MRVAVVVIVVIVRPFSRMDWIELGLDCCTAKSRINQYSVKLCEVQAE